jgi:hypothetical protein
MCALENTGITTDAIAVMYKTQLLKPLEKSSQKIHQIADRALLGGGGCHWDDDASGNEISGTQKSTPINEGLNFEMLNSHLIQGKFSSRAAYNGEKMREGLMINEIPGIHGKVVKIKERGFID